MSDYEPVPVQQQGPHPSILKALSIALASSLLVMTGFEALKQLIKPDIGIWASHTVTIVFSSLLATVCAAFTLKRFNGMQSQRLQAEEALRRLAEKRSQLELSQAKLEQEVGERRAAERALIRRQRQMGILIDANRQLNAVLDERAVLRTLIRSAAELTGASGGSAGLVQNGEVAVTVLLEQGEIRPVHRPAGGGGSAGSVLGSREIFIDKDGCAPHGMYPGSQPPATSRITVPVLGSSGEVLCLFELHRSGGREFEEEDGALLQGLASGAAVALENTRMVSERLESRQATAAASSLLSATIESTLDGIMAVDPHGEIVACNSRFVEMWGIEDDALASGDSNKLLLSLLGQVRDPVLFFEKVTQLYWEPEQESYDLVELSDGRCFERFSRPQFRDGKAAGRVWTFHDISELKKLESQLLHAQKMEAIGTLAGGIAHDFNNIMTAVIGYTELVSVGLNPPAPFGGYLQSISDASNRAVALIRNLLAYSRKDPVQTSKLECNSMVRNLIGFLERLIGADIELVMKLSDKPHGILADQGQIEQVLVNLTTNARDAMPEGGRLSLEVAPVEIGSDEITGIDGAKPGPYVRITIADTGSGIDEATRRRIFEPFFTTKEVGKGTGLGLSISYNIVKRHGGFLTVASESGRGTSFSIHLPRIQPTATLKQALAVAREIPRGEETVLLVEDNESVRSLISQVMSGKGYRVIEAVDGEDGVEKFRSHLEEISLVILDVIMPKKNGGDAFDEIRAMRSDIPAIFISGYTGDIIDRQRISEDGANFLMKPILPEKLLILARQVIDQQKGLLPAVA
ncbi:MAG TPA: PAS domain-containing sensor histidine kinase [Geobacter sp.]|nr:PAS domain-containing sensor histidine kinase [Geobacter sp.]